MTKDELLNVPVVEKEKKAKKEMSEDDFLSTFPSAETTSKEVVNKVEEKVEVAPETTSKEVVNKVEVAVDADGDSFVDNEPGMFANEMKEEIEEIKEEVKEEPKVVEDGKNVELASNVVNTNKVEEKSNLPADVKPYLDLIKEKLKAFGKFMINVFEKIGGAVEDLLKKKG